MVAGYQLIHAGDSANTELGPQKLAFILILEGKKKIIKRWVREHWCKDTAKLPCDLHLLEESFWGAAE